MTEDEKPKKKSYTPAIIAGGAALALAAGGGATLRHIRSEAARDARPSPIVQTVPSSLQTNLPTTLQSITTPDTLFQVRADGKPTFENWWPEGTPPEARELRISFDREIPKEILDDPHYEAVRGGLNELKGKTRPPLPFAQHRIKEIGDALSEQLGIKITLGTNLPNPNITIVRYNKGKGNPLEMAAGLALDAYDTAQVLTSDTNGNPVLPDISYASVKKMLPAERKTITGDFGSATYPPNKHGTRGIILLNGDSSSSVSPTTLARLIGQAALGIKLPNIDPTKPLSTQLMGEKSALHEQSAASILGDVIRGKALASASYTIPDVPADAPFSTNLVVASSKEAGTNNWAGRIDSQPPATKER